MVWVSSSRSGARDKVGRTLARGRRALRKPPDVLARRAVQEIRAIADRATAPRRAAAFDLPALLRATSSASLDELWSRCASRPHAAAFDNVAAASLEQICPGECEHVLRRADAAAERTVDLLGSGPYTLDAPIPWHTDYKTGHSWPLAFFRALDVPDLERPSDVKVPWELSRLQWLLPAAQAYLLTGDEQYAETTKSTLEDWLAANPYSRGVNWACTMEVALRIVTWTYLFHACHGSRAWSDEGFRSRLLRALYLHGDFTERYIEYSDVNGNHLDADAAGLVFAGLFFGAGAAPARWASRGWRLLSEELPRQVFGDGVDFEASTAYHRLVTELFALPALYRLRCGLPVEDEYTARLVRMVRFVAAYSAPDGGAPRWGDADDGRALPLGTQRVDDHRYLIGIVLLAFEDDDLLELVSGPRSEAYWWLGPKRAGRLPESSRREPLSATFPSGGVFVLCGRDDHVFVDCGPVGLGGRGGHGHNDCLSFEAVLDGARLVTDCGAYVYTASPADRNAFRSTSSHNTPRIDGCEQNRLDPDQLWTLANDAHPSLLKWGVDGDRVVFRGSHSGYERLPLPVTPTRTITLDTSRHVLVVADEFVGSGDHDVVVPLHLAEGVKATVIAGDTLRLQVRHLQFDVGWNDPTEWEAELGEAWVSPSYGVRRRIVRLELRRVGPLRPLTVAITPTTSRPLNVAQMAGTQG